MVCVALLVPTKGLIRVDHSPDHSGTGSLLRGSRLAVEPEDGPLDARPEIRPPIITNPIPAAIAANGLVKAFLNASIPIP